MILGPSSMLMSQQHTLNKVFLKQNIKHICTLDKYVSRGSKTSNPVLSPGVMV